MFQTKQGASKHELKCLYNKKREGTKKPKSRQNMNVIKRARTYEDDEMEEDEVEEEDTSFDAIFALTPAEVAKSYVKPKFIDQVNKYAADNKIPMPSNDLDNIIVRKMPEPGTTDSKKDASNYFVLTYAEDIEQKLRNNVD